VSISTIRFSTTGCPPRKREDVTIGDAFTWEWIVYCAIQQKAELVIVTRDTDFGAILDGESCLNDHLKQEFQERVSKQRKIILCSRLTEALKHFNIKITQKEVQAEAAVVRAADEDVSLALPYQGTPALTELLPKTRERFGAIAETRAQ
jgi:hypothetical protein